MTVANPADLTDEEIQELSVADAVDTVKDITSTLEEGDVSLSQAQELRDTAFALLDHVEQELDVADGEVNRVQP